MRRSKRRDTDNLKKTIKNETFIFKPRYTKQHTIINTMANLNKYNNKTGYHTPELSHKNRLEIEEFFGCDFIDESWHNDTCDSISNKDMGITIYLPNVTEDPKHEEEFNHFAIAVRFDSEYEYNQESPWPTFKSIEEIQEYLHSDELNKRVP